MTTIVTRAGKGSPLTNNEMDANLNNLNIYKVEKTSNTGGATLPAGTTAQRDGFPSIGDTRFNTTLGKTETYTGSRWVSGGGATGGGVDDIFYENGQTITSDYTITSGKNAMTAGPVSIDNGITVTVPNGSVWSIV